MCSDMHGKFTLGIMHELCLGTAFMLMVQLVQNQSWKAVIYLIWNCCCKTGALNGK